MQSSGVVTPGHLVGLTPEYLRALSGADSVDITRQSRRNYYVCFTFITAVPGAVSVGADLAAAALRNAELEVAALAKVKACLPGSGLRPVSSMLPGRDFPDLMVSCASVIVFTMKVVALSATITLHNSNCPGEETLTTEVALPLADAAAEACQSLADRIMFEPVATNYDHQEVHTSVTVVVRADSCLATLGGLA